MYIIMRKIINAHRWPQCRWKTNNCQEYINFYNPCIIQLWWISSNWRTSRYEYQAKFSVTFIKVELFLTQLNYSSNSGGQRRPRQWTCISKNVFQNLFSIMSLDHSSSIIFSKAETNAGLLYFLRPFFRNSKIFCQ